MTTSTTTTATATTTATTTTQEPKRKIKYRAMLSGFFAGTSSCVAKFALDPESAIPNWAQQQCLSIHDNFDGNGNGYDNYNDNDGDTTRMDYTCLIVSLLPRGIFLLVMIGLNLVMVASFMQGMSESGTVIATALSTGINFSISALYGVLLFNEHLNLVWLFGFSLILVGISMLASVSVKTVKKE